MRDSAPWETAVRGRMFGRDSYGAGNVKDWFNLIQFDIVMIVGSGPGMTALSTGSDDQGARYRHRVFRGPSDHGESRPPSGHGVWTARVAGRVNA